MPPELNQSSPPSERPIETEADDFLERGTFVRRLTDSLINPRTKKSTGVVIGITGPWGSGKSSILNLLKNRVRETHPDTLIVSFNPWLISDRNDLIQSFIGELISTINAEPRLKRSFKAVTKTVTKYGRLLAPAANVFLPGSGVIASSGFGAIDAAVSGKPSLASLRATLLQQLDKISTPILVLIDELDRVEDHEIRTVAQLVRSIADFPRISYLLAYDPKRVTQALGEGADGPAREERGRAYLEKIVQLQIPLPMTLDTEIASLVRAELIALREETGLPPDFETGERYLRLIKILIPSIISTPRDAKRLVGTYLALSGMLIGDVDPIDLLGYCTLLTKAPRTVAHIRDNPFVFVDDALSVDEAARQMENEKLSIEDRFKTFLPEGEPGDGIRQLLGFLFPSFSNGNGSSSAEQADPLHLRRPLLTTLRLGLLHGDYSRTDIEKLTKSEPPEIIDVLKNAYSSDRLGQLIDRLDDVYAGLKDVDHVKFWKAVSLFLKKPDCEWMTQYVPMHEVINNFSIVLEKLALRSDDGRGVVANVFRNLMNADEDNLTAILIRHHIFLYGLFGHEPEGNTSRFFLNKEQCEATAREMSLTIKSKHLAGKLIPCRWDLQPIYTAAEMGIWDDTCRTLMDHALAEEAAIDGFTLMLYGGFFSTEADTVDKICGYQSYRSRVNIRLSSISSAGRQPVHETVVAALKKATDNRWNRLST